jgi:hypothetical protein
MSDDIPDYLRDYITRSSKAMEDIAAGMAKRDDFEKESDEKWRQTIETFNRDFVVHNAEVENKFENICTVMNASIEESKNFRTEVWGFMKGIVEKVVIVAILALAVLGGAGEILQYLFPGA